MNSPLALRLSFLLVLLALPLVSSAQDASQWLSQDIGAVAKPGNSFYDAASGTAWVNGSGAEISGTADACQFLYRPLSGDGEIVAHLSATTVITGSAKLGVMMRENLGPNSANAFLGITANNGYAFLSQRPSTGAATASFPLNTLRPSWIKLARLGNVFSAYVSNDGQLWTFLDARVVLMVQPVDVGFAVSSRAGDGSLCNAGFDRIQVRASDAATLPAPIALAVSAATDHSISLQWPAPVGAPAGLTYDVFRDGIQAAFGLSAASFTDSPLFNGTAFSYTVRSASAAGSSLSPGVAVSAATLPGGALPAPWVSQVIGSVLQPGAASASTAGPPVYTVSASGGDIWGTADACRFVYQPISGDGVVMARVDSLSQVDPWSKAGVMIRESLAPGAANASLFATPGYGTAFQQRTATGASTTQWLANNPSKAPVWAMISRQANTFTAYTSADGVAWSQVSQTTLAMASTAYFGVALTSHNNAVPAKAAFDQLKAATDVQPPNAPAGLAAAAVSDTWVTLSWAKAADDGQVVSYDVYRDGAKLVTVAGTRLTDRGLAPSSVHRYSVVARDTMGRVSAASQTFSLATLAASLPPPWLHQDVGVVGTPGSADFSPAPPGTDSTQSAFSIQASGRDIGGDSVGSKQVGSQTVYLYADFFHYAYQPMAGDFQITARLADLSPTDPLSKAGIMIRETLDSGARNVALLATAANGINFQWRSLTTAATRVTTSLGAAPYWVRLQRQGSVFTAWVSADGAQWIVAGSEVMDLPGQIFVGLAASSHGDPRLTTAYFDHVAVQSNGSSGSGAGGTPSQPPAYVTGAPTAILNGAAASASAGGWAVNYANGFISLSGGRGYVEYGFSVDQRGIYEVQVMGSSTSYDPYPRAYNLIVSIDGISLGEYPLVSGYGGAASIKALTPYLTPGAHTARVFWDNAEASRSFAVQQVRIAPVTGAAPNGSGITNWAADHLSRANALDPVATTSATSPVCIEGRAEFFDVLALTAASGGTISPKHGPNTRWYADAPLSANAPTRVVVSYEQGALTQSCLVNWGTTDLLTSPGLSVRAGDSLLLTAAPPGSAGGSVQIQVAGPASYSATTTPTAPVPYRFSSPGAYTLTGSYQGGAGTAHRSIVVNVAAAAFSGSPAAYVGRSRDWDNPQVAPWMPVEADARMQFEMVDALPGGGTRFRFIADAPEPRYVLARLWEGGPVLASTQIATFSLASSDDTYVKVIQTYPDGSQLVEMGVFVSQVLPGVTYQITPAVGGITFDDGTIVKTLTAADFDGSGMAKVRFIRPAHSRTSVCNIVKVFDGSTFLGIR